MSTRKAFAPAPQPFAERMGDGLLQQIFSISSHERSTGLVIALTSIDPRAGVTYSAEALAQELGSDNGGSVICLDSRALLQLQREVAQIPQGSLAKILPEPDRHDSLERHGLSHWRDGYTFRQSVINRLRLKYQYVLIACPSLKESADILSIASVVDGIIIVVEANRTQSRQIAVIERTITSARGRILGHILNKRAYSIPSSVYSRLSIFGI